MRPNAPKVDTVQSVVTFATARMTARATTWAIVSVNAAGPVNCARIDVPLVIQYIKSFHFSFHFSFFSHFEGFYGKKCRQPCPSCVNGEFGYRPVSAYYFQLFIVFFFYFFSFPSR